MFGYECEECHDGTVRETVFPEFETRFENVPFVVPGAVVGVCDNCGARHFSAKEYRRWRELYRESREQQGAVLSAADIRRLREDLGLGKADFAALLGATRQSVYHWERGDRERPQSRMVDNLLKLVRESCDHGSVDVVRRLLAAAESAGVEVQAGAGACVAVTAESALSDLPEPSAYDANFDEGRGRPPTSCTLSVIAPAEAAG